MKHTALALIFGATIVTCSVIADIALESYCGTWLEVEKVRAEAQRSKVVILRVPDDSAEESTPKPKA